ncbi:hypothetical protein Moror_602 [Moniliophthora roreri MCA 2997]|uniref:Uncharacterized protein n=1 Tax=Moniliophthora roreri (strain MCA 2997) TaxID=1381753 RepID=V2WD44_MONRO|nr:hypothetical protein Moror_602 [Moniliophthora roreri MCA 2997]
MPRNLWLFGTGFRLISLISVPQNATPTYLTTSVTLVLRTVIVIKIHRVGTMSASLCAPVLALDTYRTPVHAASASRYTNSNPNIQSSSPNSKITETGGYTMQQFSEDDSLTSLDGSQALVRRHLLRLLRVQLRTVGAKPAPVGTEWRIVIAFMLDVLVGVSSGAEAGWGGAVDGYRGVTL